MKMQPYGHGGGEEKYDDGGHLAREGLRQRIQTFEKN